jgi:uncharacterized protein with FMN-binding domain
MQTKKKKRLFIILGILAILLIFISSFILTLGSKMSNYKKFDFSKLDFTAIPDGTYRGSEDASIVKATVEVTVKDHIITNAKIISHQNGKGKPAEVIVDDFVKNNSVAVDTISGATLSSYVLKKAAYNALKNSIK